MQLKQRRRRHHHHCSSTNGGTPIPTMLVGVAAVLFCVLAGGAEANVADIAKIMDRTKSTPLNPNDMFGTNTASQPTAGAAKTFAAIDKLYDDYDKSMRDNIAGTIGPALTQADIDDSKKALTLLCQAYNQLADQTDITDVATVKAARVQKIITDIGGDSKKLVTNDATRPDPYYDYALLECSFQRHQHLVITSAELEITSASAATPNDVQKAHKVLLDAFTLLLPKADDYGTKVKAEVDRIRVLKPQTQAHDVVLQPSTAPTSPTAQLTEHFLELNAKYEVKKALVNPATAATATFPAGVTAPTEQEASAAFKVLYQSMAALTPLAKDHQAKGQAEIARVKPMSAQTDAYKVLFEKTTGAPAPGTPLKETALELLGNYAVKSALVDPASFTLVTGGTALTGTGLSDATTALEVLQQSAVQLMPQAADHTAAGTAEVARIKVLNAQNDVDAYNAVFDKGITALPTPMDAYGTLIGEYALRRALVDPGTFQPALAGTQLTEAQDAYEVLLQSVVHLMPLTPATALTTAKEAEIKRIKDKDVKKDAYLVLFERAAPSTAAAPAPLPETYKILTAMYELKKALLEPSKFTTLNATTTPTLADATKAFEVLYGSFAQLTPQAVDHQTAGQNEVVRILQKNAETDAYEIVFHMTPTTPPTQFQLLDVEEHFALTRALVDPLTYTPALDDKTVPTYMDAMLALIMLREARLRERMQASDTLIMDAAQQKRLADDFIKIPFGVLATRYTAGTTVADYENMLGYKAGDDVNVKYAAKMAEFDKLKADIGTDVEIGKDKTVLQPELASAVDEALKILDIAKQAIATGTVPGVVPPVPSPAPGPVPGPPGAAGYATDAEVDTAEKVKPVQKDDCTNLGLNCGNFMILCKNRAYHKLMYAQCEETCGVCIKKCKDRYEPDCQSWGQTYCQSTAVSKGMKLRNCAKFCGFC